MPDQAAIMMAIELIESGNPDDEAVGLMALGRIIADDDDEDVLLLLVAAGPNDERLPVPYLLYVFGAVACRGIAFDDRMGSIRHAQANPDPGPCGTSATPPPHTHRRREDAPTSAFEMWMLLEQTPMHWDALFRFTVPEFFFDLLPALHLPQYFRVDG
jgi:hypothetical protein